MTQAKPFDFILGSPYWIWVGIAMFSAVFAALFAVIFWEYFGPKPKRRISVNGTSIELWDKERKMPGGAGGIIVPVASDMKMSSGISKWVRDASANAVQYEALRVAPMQPGEFFVGSGGRYRFAKTALAVVMDDQKRTSTEWIKRAVSASISNLREMDADVILVPDMTEDLLRQPTWISDEQRKETCRPIARAMLDGIIEGCQDVERVKIWAWRGNADIWAEELDRISAEQKALIATPVHA
ncbi:MAG: hypothetical protein ABJA67_07625 [Chthonomonadales bacterium]